MTTTPLPPGAAPSNAEYSTREAAVRLGYSSPNQLHNDRRKHDLELDLAAGELRPLPGFASDEERRAWYAEHAVYCPRYAATKLPGRDWRYEREWIEAMAPLTSLGRAVIFAQALDRAVKTLSGVLGRPVSVVAHAAGRRKITGASDERT